MSGYGFRDLGPELSAEKILAKRPDSVLWRHYLGCDFELGRSIRAPYRPDKNPSFCLQYNSRSGKIIGKDYGKGGFHGDVFDYVMMKYNLDYYSALVRVNIDFDLGLSYNSELYGKGAANKITKREAAVLDTFQEKYERTEVVLLYKWRYWDKGNIAYWTQYGISSRTLFKYKVMVADKLYRNGAQIYWYKSSDPCYVYDFPITEYRLKPHLKCYWPMRTTIRFMGNCSNARDVQGYDQCSIAKKEYADLLVLTKSMKDCMVLHEQGIEAMATHGESQKFDADFIRHLRKYYKRIVSLYDRDATGVVGARYLWREYGISPYFIDKKYVCKDISDLYKTHGESTVKQFIQKLRK